MMRVSFFDKRRETIYVVESVENMCTCQIRVNGRATNVWQMVLSDGRNIVVKRVDYDLITVVSV